jgi:hypothetical protein
MADPIEKPFINLACSISVSAMEPKLNCASGSRPAGGSTSSTTTAATSSSSFVGFGRSLLPIRSAIAITSSLSSLLFSSLADGMGSGGGVAGGGATAAPLPLPLSPPSVSLSKAVVVAGLPVVWVRVVLVVLILV